jgi:hypothetical protein
VNEFRIRVEASDKQEAIDEAALFASNVITLVKAMSNQHDEWECVDDVTSAKNGKYECRMKFIYRSQIQ